MSSCATVDANGFVHQDPTPVAQCTGFVLVSSSEYANLSASMEPFDYAQGATLWSFAFTSVLMCWFVARGAGTILGLIRKR